MIKAVFAVLLSSFAMAQTTPTVYQVLDLPDTAGVALRTSVGGVHAGDLTIRMEHTTLNQVKQRFGGNIQNGGDASGAVAWICYRSQTAGATPVIYWFDANAEMSSNLSIGQVAVQLSPPAAVLQSCDQAPASLTGIRFSLPGIGATEDALKQRFGRIKADAKGVLAFTHEIPLPQQCTTEQTVSYRLGEGKVKLFAFSQVSSC